MDIVERFKKYIAFDTMSDEESLTYPSTSSQLLFGDLLVSDLVNIGVKNAYKDEYGLVYGSINNGSKKTIGLIAHMDTSSAFKGGLTNPKIIKNYDGSTIILNKENSMSVEEFPILKDLIGEDLITTDGEHLLGADDKAGISIIMSFAEYYISHQELFNFNLSICFTPDEEIGSGWLHFDLNKFKADYAFTLDGESCYEANQENFNAMSVNIKISGISTHPGSAKNVMVNAASIACKIQSLLPSEQVPEKTSDYEGFIHLTSLKGDVENASMHYILRDHNYQLLLKKKETVIAVINKVLKENERCKIEYQIKEEYRNMKEYFIEHPECIELINRAYLVSKTKLFYLPIRGGTDGARITYMGLGCPNLGTGSFNHHGRYEICSINQMKKLVSILIDLFKLEY